MVHNRAGWLPDIEQRQTGQPVQLRSRSGSGRIGGYAAVFGVKSEPLGGFVEQVDRRAFNKTAGDGWPAVICRYNHSDDYLLGTIDAGTLQLSIDNTGLDYRVDLPECRSDVLEMVTRGDVSKSSFAFRAYDDSWEFDDGQPLRTILAARLVDVAPVTIPAYRDSSAALRSLAWHSDAPVAEIIDMHNSGELRKLFVRTDRRTERRGCSGPEALVQLMKKRYGPDQADADGRPTVPKDGVTALVQIQRKRWTGQ